LATCFDAIVIGSGVGGMCAAALLASEGQRVLLAEKRRYLGGRFSMVDHNGYKCATGGLAVPVGRDLEQVCDAIGLSSSDELLMDYSAISVGCSRRVKMIDVPSLEAEGIAPPGKHLDTVGAAPLDSLEPGDIKLEFEEVMKDLDDIFPDFANRCTVLTKTCYRGKWSGFRTVPHKHVDHRTPLVNLYNVGDAACPSGYDGSMGAAKSARLAVEEILRQ